MVGIVRYVLILMIAAGVLLVPVETSATTESWAGRTIYRVWSETDQQQVQPAARCSATRLVISVKGRGLVRDACVFGKGEGVRLARYTADNGQFVYAIAFSSEATFTPIKGLCENLSECAYSQSEDVLLLQSRITTLWHGHALIGNFTKQLRYVTEDSGYYRFSLPPESPFIATPGRVFATGATSVSQNGRWAIVELHGFGFVRVDMQNLSYRRIIAPGAMYGVANDPAFEVTVSDDGRRVAVAGAGAGIDVYEITDTCGDILEDGSSFQFFFNATGCPGATIERFNLYPGFISAHEPRFTDTARGLSLLVSKLNGSERTILSPDSTLAHKGNGYRAFGDSFTSGEGELDDRFYLPEANNSANRCHVSSRSYPYLLGIHLGVPTINSACSGGKIRDVLGEIERSVAQSSEAISIGIGGNDASLIGKLKTCLGLGTCEWADPDKRIATAHELRALLPGFINMLDQAKRSFPGSLLFIVGYPSVINNATNAQCDALISVLLDKEERRFLSESLAYLNKVLREAAHYSSVAFIDVEDALIGERLCDEPGEGMNGIRYGNDIAPLVAMPSIKVVGSESFHPTPHGHALISKSIADQVGDSWMSLQCGCASNIGALEPSDYWSRYIDASWVDVEQKGDDFLDSTYVTPASRHAFSFPPGTFKPNTEVILELHSDIQMLGRYLSGGDGSLEGEVTIPDIVAGYHTVHSYGVSVSKWPLDLYQIVYIQPAAEMGVATIPTNSRSVPRRETTLMTRTFSSSILGDQGQYGAQSVVASSKVRAVSHQAKVPWTHLMVIGFILCIAGIVYVFICKKRSSVSRRGG